MTRFRTMLFIFLGLLSIATWAAPAQIGPIPGMAPFLFHQSGPALLFETILSSTTGGGGIKSGVTYSSVPIGPAAANRTVIVAAALRENGVETISSVTIGGISATNGGSPGFKCNSQTFVTCMYVWEATVPTGTTANIVVTYTNPVDSADGLAVWSAYGLTSNTPTATANSVSTTAPSLNLNVSAGGIVVAATWTIQVPSVACASWTGVTAQGEVLGDPGTSPAEFMDAASASSLVAGTPRTVGCTYNGTSTNEPVAFAASFR